MSKAIFVMDEIPDSCARCPIVCKETYGIGAIRSEVCPLKEMPERAKIDEFWDDDSVGYVAGWNACIDKIGGEEE